MKFNSSKKSDISNVIRTFKLLLNTESDQFKQLATTILSEFCFNLRSRKISLLFIVHRVGGVKNLKNIPYLSMTLILRMFEIKCFKLNPNNKNVSYQK